MTTDGPAARRSSGFDLMRSLAASSIAAGTPLGWYEELYAAAEAGSVSVPWDHGVPTLLLADWFQRHSGRVSSGRAVVVGCAYGDDAELVAAQGFETTAFDIAPSAIVAAQARHSGSAVHYVAADLLALPSGWLRAFDLVVECTTVQSLPPEFHSRAAAAVGSLCAVAGTVLVVARKATELDTEGPPWLLTDDEIGQFSVDGVVLEGIESVQLPGGARWLVELRRAV